jgi:hypothetical protein
VRRLLTLELYARRTAPLVQPQVSSDPEKRARARALAESMDPKTLDAYVGEYEIEEFGITLSVSRIQGRLYTQQPCIARTELLPLSETRFFLVADSEVLIEFSLDEANRVTGMVATKDGQSFVARRK